jgi:hypothetical protein
LPRPPGRRLPEDFAHAEALAAPWRSTTLALLADLGRTQFAARCDVVRATIAKHPEGISNRALYRIHRGLRPVEMREVCESLVEQGDVHRHETKADKNSITLYRPSPGGPPC